MRKDFYIFRHGETDFNRAGIRQGQKIDADLNATGILQAEELANKLNDVSLEVIFSSPLKRAKKTAEIVSSIKGVGVIFLDNLKEGCFGIFEGLGKDEIKKDYSEEARLWDSMDDEHFDYGLPDGETKREISNRMFSVLNDLLSTEYKTIGISSHGRIIRLFLHRLGLKLDKMDNAGLYHVIYDDGKWVIAN